MPVGSSEEFDSQIYLETKQQDGIDVAESDLTDSVPEIENGDHSQGERHKNQTYGGDVVHISEGGLFKCSVCECADGGYGHIAECHRDGESCRRQKEKGLYALNHIGLYVGQFWEAKIGVWRELDKFQSSFWRSSGGNSR